MRVFPKSVALRNVVPFTTVMLAFLGAAGFLQPMGISTERIILGLLGVLAIDTLIERLSYLRRLEDSIHSLGIRLEKPRLLNRKLLDDEEPFDQCLQQGRDLLIAGASLSVTIGPRRDLFKQMAMKGTKLRFLLIDPESLCLEIAAQAHGISPDSMRADIKSALDHLRPIVESIGISKKHPPQVRLVSTIVGVSAVMRDGNSDTGEIRCELHLYKADVGGRPTLRLTPADGKIYHRYKEAIEQLWTDSKPWCPK